MEVHEGKRIQMTTPTQKVDLEELEEELKRISSWPWMQFINSNGVYTIETKDPLKRLQSDTACQIYDPCDKYEANRYFIAKSPERIHDLIEEVEKLQHHNEELQSLNSMQEMRIGQLEDALEFYSADKTHFCNECICRLVGEEEDCIIHDDGQKARKALGKVEE